MKHNYTLRTVTLCIDILNSSSIDESLRKDTFNHACDLIYDLYVLSAIDTVVRDDLTAQVSTAYVNGGL